jgi:hypothetical protein
MVRTLPGAAATEIAKTHGTEPLLIIKINWGNSGVIRYYCDRLFSGIEGKIISVSGLNSVTKIGRSGSTGSVSIVLDDTDGDIKSIMDTVIVGGRTTELHKSQCWINQAFGDIAITNQFLLFEGEVSTPIVWKEKTRTVEFEVIGFLESGEVGFSPDQTFANYVMPDALGKAWPLCFGDCIRIPAVKVSEEIRGATFTTYSLITRADIKKIVNNARLQASLRWEALLLFKQVKDIIDAMAIHGCTPGNPIVSECDDLEARWNALPAQMIQTVKKYIDAYVEGLTIMDNLIADSPTRENDIRDYIEKAIEFQWYYFRYNRANGQLSWAQARLVELQQEWIDTGCNSNPTSTECQEIQRKIDQANDTIIDLNDDITNFGTLFGAAFADYFAAGEKLLLWGLAQLEVENGDEFPQGTPTQVIVKGKRLQGTFADRVFTITESDLPTYTDIDFDTRIEDPALPQINQFWITDTSFDLKDQYCMIDEGGVKSIIKVVEQNGARCWFEPVIWEITNDQWEANPDDPTYIGFYKLFGPSFGTITKTSPILSTDWINELTLPEAYNTIYYDPLTDPVNPVVGYYQVPEKTWGFRAGDIVYLANEYQDVYVCHLGSNADVKEVYARRTVRNARDLRPVPTRYYEVDQSRNIGGQLVTALVFKRPLDSYNEEEWEDKIFVTLESPLTSNTAGIIQYIVETWTSLIIDTFSFTITAAYLSDLPSHFALLKKENAIKLIEEIAWQARCAVWIQSGTVYIKFLALEVASVKTITNSDVHDDGVELSLTETEDLVTKFVANWRYDYSKDTVNSYILRNNIPKYGLIERSYDFYIYNIGALVLLSATFWSIRYSNTWRRVKFKGFLNLLDLEIYDTITLGMVSDLVAQGNPKAIIENIRYDSSDYSLIFDTWLPVRSDMIAEYEFAWPSGSAAAYPTIDDPYVGVD